LKYDHLVLLRVPKRVILEWKRKEKCYSMKTLNDAIVMRNTLLKNLEKRTFARHARTMKLLIVVAGGGPTGVEVSGMFEMRKNILLKNIRN
jgi:NADH dehydrogenase